MTTTDLLQRRLLNQQIAFTKFTQPAEIVQWMVAMQAQEYAMAKWAIGLRLQNAKDEWIEDAFNAGAILRTHLMRPTWHFVAPADIRWLTELTAPRVKAFNAFTYRQQELNAGVFRKSHKVITKALEGGQMLTRTELQAILAQKKISAGGIRLAALLMEAELEGLICSGPRKGKQFTYALLDERVPAVKKLSKQDALLQFAQRYFTSRGPATVRDFATWSGLLMKDAKAGANALSAAFVHEQWQGQDYIFHPETAVPFSKKMQTSFLMPDYDEYGMSYKDRSALFSQSLPDLSLFKGGNPFFNRMIVLNGQIEGTWRRVIRDDKVFLETVPFQKLSRAQERALQKAKQRYTTFIGKHTGEE